MLVTNNFVSSRAWCKRHSVKCVFLSAVDWLLSFPSCLPFVLIMLLLSAFRRTVSNDPIMMRETPDILAISNALARTVGQYASYGVVSIGPVVATILAAAHHSQAAVKVASVAFISLTVVINLIIWKCGTALVGTINRSLQNSASSRRWPAASAITVASDAEQRENQERDDAVEEGKRRVGGDLNLLAARKKIKIAMSICLTMAVQTVLVLMFAVVSTYGTAAPLLFFGTTLGLAPPFWFMLNVQMHAGRSRPRVLQGVHSQQQTSRFRGTTTSMPNSVTSHCPQRIIPTETPVSS